MIRLCSGVGVHLPLAAGHGDVYEAAGVSEPLLGAALGGLLLLLGLNLFPLRQRSVPQCVLVLVRSNGRCGDASRSDHGGAGRVCREACVLTLAAGC